MQEIATECIRKIKAIDFNQLEISKYNREYIDRLSPHLNMAFTTGSNPCNFYKCAVLRKEMRMDEKENFTEREKYIKKQFVDLNINQLQKFSRMTRGYNYADIQKAIDLYKQDKRYPAPVKDPYNTCNPQTGNWHERILSLDEYRQIIHQAGLQVDFIPGFYNENRKKPVISKIFHSLNWLIQNSRSLGFFFALYIILKLK